MRSAELVLKDQPDLPLQKLGQFEPIPFSPQASRRPGHDLDARFGYVSLEEKLGPFIVEQCSASVRGHMEEWEVHDQKLYLVAILGNPCGTATEVPLAVLFQKTTGPVHGNWFSGTLDVSRGHPSPGLQWSPALAYESHLLLEIRDGVVVARCEPFRSNHH